jgi:HlyD family secretion protein
MTMRHEIQRHKIFRRLAIWPVLALCLFAAACSNGNDDVLQGWIEGDFIFVSPDEQGRIETMLVRQGDTVKTGQLMFTLDQDLQAADLGVAEATLTNTKQAFDRAQQLAKSGSGTQRDFDVAQALYREAQARLAAAQTRVTRRKVLSPVDGLIQTVYFRPGETVPPGRPIVSILPPGNVKVRFFVSEPMLARIAIDDPIKFGCDGCPSDMTGSITFISRNAEYTPPVIYSQQERHKLVYLVEARPKDPNALRVGQPVDVVVTPKASESKAPAK